MKTFLLQQRFLLLSGLLALACIPSIAQSDEPLRTIAEIRRLTKQDLVHEKDVELIGTVVITSPHHVPIVLWDGESIWCEPRYDVQAAGDLHLGDVIQVRGKALAGRFAPTVAIESFTKVDSKPLPEARPLNWTQIQSGAFDCQFVRTQGTVKSIDFNPLFDQKALVLRLAVPEGELICMVMQWPDQPEKLVDAEVEVSGFCMPIFNSRAQFMRMNLVGAHQEAVKVLKPSRSDPFEAPETPIDDLILFSPADALAPRLPHRKRVSGVVTAAVSGSYLYLSNQSRNMRVESKQIKNLVPGDFVDCCGFVTPGECYPILSDAIIRKRGRSNVPEPAQVSTGRVLDVELPPLGVQWVDYDSRLVEFTGRLEGLENLPDFPLRIVIDSEGTLVPAQLEPTSLRGHLPQLEHGSLIKITGICQVRYHPARHAAFTKWPESFSVLLRSPDDVQVLEPASWWTAERLAGALAWTLAILAVAIAMIEYLRRRILQKEKEHQAAGRQQRELQLKTQAVIAERERLAMDLHDTLNQTLAAARMHLYTMKASQPSPAFQSNIGLVESAINQAMDESRRSIYDLHERVLRNKSLDQAIDDSCSLLVQGQSVELVVNKSEEPIHIDLVSTQHLLCLAREAVANALKHAKAKKIEITLKRSQEWVEIIVEDDGVGFEPSRFKQVIERQYGIRGMKSRADQLRGSVDFVKRNPSGTEVRITSPLGRPLSEPKEATVP